MECDISAFSVLSGSDARELLELTAEVLCVPVTALLAYLADGIDGEDKLILGKLDPVLDNVVHAARSESILIKEMEMSSTDIELSCHIGNVPVLFGMQHNVSSDLKELLSVGSGLGCCDVLGELSDKKMEKISHIGISGRVIFCSLPVDKFNYVVDVFGIRRSEGDIVHREMSDEILVCIKVDPVIGIRLTHIGHVTLTRIRRKEYYRLSGEISHYAVDQELNGGVCED